MSEDEACWKGLG